MSGLLDLTVDHHDSEAGEAETQDSKNQLQNILEHLQQEAEKPANMAFYGNSKRAKKKIYANNITCGRYTQTR